MTLLARWAREVAGVQLAVAAAATLAVAAIELADRGSLAGVPHGVAAISPTLAALGAALAVRRWQRSGAWTGIAACGVGPIRLALTAGFAGMVLGILAQVGVVAAPARPGTWTSAPLPDGRIAWADGERVVHTRDGCIEAVDAGAPLTSHADPDPATLVAVGAWSALGSLAAAHPAGIPVILAASVAERVIAVTVAVAVRQRGLTPTWELLLPLSALALTVSLAGASIPGYKQPFEPG